MSSSIMAAGSEARQRDIFPLPTFATDSRRQFTQGRRARARANFGHYWRDWANDGIRALNGMYGVQDLTSVTTAADGSNATQRVVLDHLADTYQSFVKECGTAATEAGVPTGDAALAELLANATGYSDTSARVVPYSYDKVSWPDAGSSPIPLGSLVPAAEQDRLGAWRQSMLRDQASFSVELEKASSFRPYVDPGLQRRPRDYAKFLQRLDSAGMVKWRVARQQETSTVGVFFVIKSDGTSQRLIFDTRWANLAFVDPVASRLPTAAAWGSLELSGEAVLAQGDIQCAFYHLKLPDGMEEMFRLPVISNRYLGFSRLDGSACTARTILVPMVTVAPMGWTWALHFCQAALVSALEEEGFTAKHRIEDGQPSPALVRESDLAAAGYVDNFAVVGRSSAAVVDGRDRITRNLVAKGLPVHGCDEAAAETIFTGLEFNGRRGRIRVRPDRLRRLALSIDALLRRGWASGPAMSVVTGHLTWAMISRRESLSIMAGIYAFVRRAGLKPIPLWPSVVRELAWLRATLPLWSCRLDLPWSASVHCSDASPYGRGVCERRLPLDIIAELGRANEKWRYKTVNAITARRHALSSASDIITDKEIENYARAPEVRHREFQEIPPTLLEPADWKIVHSSRHYSLGKNILQYEAQALETALRHALRNSSALHHRHLCLVDNLALALAAGKGRSTTARLRASLRRIAALLLACDVRLYVRWVPSERNPSDKPSRGGFFAGPAFVPHGADAFDTEASGAAEASQAHPDGGSEASSPRPGRAAGGSAHHLGGEHVDGRLARPVSRPCGTIQDVVLLDELQLDHSSGARRGADGVHGQPVPRRLRHGNGEDDGSSLEVLPSRVVCRPERPSTDTPGSGWLEEIGAPKDAATASEDRRRGRCGLADVSAPAVDGGLRVGDLRRLPPAERGVPIDRGFGGPPGLSGRAPAGIVGSDRQRQQGGRPRQDRHQRPLSLDRLGGALRPFGGFEDGEAREASALDLLTRRDEGALQGGGDGVGIGRRGPDALHLEARRSQSRPPPRPAHATGSKGARGLADGCQPPPVREEDAPPGEDKRDPGGCAMLRRECLGPGPGADAAGGAGSPIPADDADNKAEAVPGAEGHADLVAPVDIYLKRIFDRATSHSVRRSRMISLEVCSSRGGLARHWQDDGHGCVTLDVARHASLDLAEPRLVKRVIGWITGSCVETAWFSPPQETWSTLDRTALRSDSHPLGRDDPGKGGDRVRVANQTMKGALQIFSACARMGVPCILEGPTSSYMWRHPLVEAASLSRFSEFVQLDVCMFGSRWRRSTTLLAVRCPEAANLGRRCHGGRVCTATGKQHLQSWDNAPRAKAWRRRARRLPTQLTQRLAHMLARAATVRRETKSRRLFGLGPDSRIT